MFDDSRPIFVQIAEQIEADVVSGVLAEDSRAPSSNELATFHRINPATAAKGIAQLASDGIVYKRRGLGMFVATGAREALIAKRRAAFPIGFVAPLMDEARALGIDIEEVIVMIKKRGDSP